LLLAVAEWAAIGWLARGEFAGMWEIWEALLRLVPLAWIVVGAAGLLGAVVLFLCESQRPAARLALAGIGFCGGALVAVGVSKGRHFSDVPVRVGFVLAVASLGFFIGHLFGPRLGRWSVRSSSRAALAAALAALALELANRFILPRLYPAFHLGLAVLTGMTAPLLGRGLFRFFRLDPTRFFGASKLAPWFGSGAAAVPVLLAIGFAPASARRLALSDNLRFIFYEKAPLVGLGVELSTALAPPAPLEGNELDDEAKSDRRLDVDFRNHDLLLVTVDALRADHVGAYGYDRPTTPNLDRLAREGAMFLRAYCPTPHTSYSVTSMMTGKNLRPLLSQGVGLDSDTFAGILRTYGYRTAAFYPPAVFFIDEELFVPFRDRKLDFEYARVEFSDPHERAEALGRYLETQPGDKRLFLWVHLFEPHEPYVAHPEHAFGDRDIDRYDGEIAFADEGIGEIVTRVRAKRPGAVIIVTADHGEEFGEHGGRYHGTTVYEEQVRVPLVVVGPGVAAARRIEAPVQTIDILPSVLAALDIPRPPRIGGKSFGRWLGAPKGAPSAAPATPAAAGGKESPVVAIALTDDQAMLADAEWRLICARRAGACALYNLDLDPSERRDVSAAEGDRFLAMKTSLRRLEASQGAYENGGPRGAGARPWPEPIRRGLAGDGDAARDIAALLDDSDVTFRRKSAELLFDLKRKEAAPELRLALSRDEDDIVRRYAALALTRLGEGAPRAIDLLDDPEPSWRRLAALALAENGDGRGEPTLVAWWQSEPPPFVRAREVLAALAQIRAKDATPALIRSLDDVRLRPYVAEALAAIGQPSARAPLAERWSAERYQNARVALGEALVRLGAKRELMAPLVRFLGTPDPLPGGLDLARRAGILEQIGGPTSADLARLAADTDGGELLRVAVWRGGNGTGRRILARARSTDGHAGQVRIGMPRGDVIEIDPRSAVTLDVAAVPEGGAVEVFASLPNEVEPTSPASPTGVRAAGGAPADELRLVVARSGNVAIEALAVVPLADELPPPPPEPWPAPPEVLEAETAASSSPH
jgi:arylsulfatase A-like enzyme